MIVSTNVTEREWDAFVDRHPGATSCHLWRWRRVLERAFEHGAVYLAARRDSEIAGVLPTVMVKSWMFGRSLVSLPSLNYGGILADDAEAAQALLEHAAAVAAEHRASHVELRHRTRRFDHLPAKSHKVTMLLKLAGNEGAAWEQLDRKVRNQIKKAQKSGLTAATGGRELIDEFYSVFARNMRDLGTPVYGRRYFEAIVDEFPSNARMFVVRQGDVALAGGLGFAYRDTFEMPSASALRSARPLCANVLLYWHAMQHAIADGRTIFDFGRSTPGDGPFQFKRQWGAEPSPVAWEYRLLRGSMPDQSPSNPKFKAAIAMWKRLPLPVATWLGPSIVRSIP